MSFSLSPARLHTDPEGHSPPMRVWLWAQDWVCGSLYYGGIGETRFVLDFEAEDAHPFRDIYRRPSKFKFFLPTDADLQHPAHR